ncbi:hypothetical protein [Paenibacillus pseudetheri]|uniref:hypothetical protein n=1 Tax=Paenibacillus pseudetheri TaxID=2897682 RepID=UPI001F468BE9|nr:hypothetical protein [Paenibacillus pseudetheri]
MAGPDIAVVHEPSESVFSLDKEKVAIVGIPKIHDAKGIVMKILNIHDCKIEVEVKSEKEPGLL